jgi:hypothetical protein
MNMTITITRVKHSMKIISALVISFIVLISACQPNPAAVIEQHLETVKVGYCPTMQPHIQALMSTHQSIIPELYDNSAAAMQALYEGQVQAILIGRTARQNELSDQLRLVRLVDGLTLITHQPGVIRFEDIPKITLLTCEDEAAIADLIPVRFNVVYFDEFDQMLVNFDATVAVLLRWSQVSPVDNLLVPVDAAGNKVAGFRSPHFYYLDAHEAALAGIINTLPFE